MYEADNFVVLTADGDMCTSQGPGGGPRRVVKEEEEEGEEYDSHN
jgi:hypothetical protein